MTHEQRVEYIRQVFNALIEVAKQDRTAALMEFIQWLRSPDGALAWPYLWEPEYRQIMVDIASHFLSIFHKLLILQQAPDNRQ